jgi:hypothetical protein
LRSIESLIPSSVGLISISGIQGDVTGQSAGYDLDEPYPGQRQPIQLLEKVNREFPGECWLIIEENLINHANRQATLAFTA